MTYWAWNINFADMDRQMNTSLNLVDLLHPAGIPALCAVLFGRMVGRSSLGTERLWVRAISLVLRRSNRIKNATHENLRICFPLKPKEEIETLAGLATQEVARSFVETIRVWFPSKSRKDPYPDVTYRGLEHFEAALSSGRGILLLNCHFGSLDLNGWFFSHLDRQNRPLIGVYRRPSNPYVDKVVRHGRANIVDQAIPINDPRAIIAELKAGSIVWIAPDLEAHGNRAAIADFFGAPASTSTWPSRLAKAGAALVLPTRHTRQSESQEYVYEFLPPFKDFPSGSDTKDARRFNEYVEDVIKQKPEMYWWCIKRFKHFRPPAR